MIDMQLGGNWVGDVNESTLPRKMYVNWVKYYGAFQDGKRISKKDYDEIISMPSMV